MFGLGFTEILVLGLIAFLVFGPKRFPTAMKSFLAFINEIRRTFSEVKTEFDDIQTTTEREIQKITESAEKYLDFKEDRKNSATKETSPDSNTEPSPDLKKQHPTDSNTESFPDSKKEDFLPTGQNKKES